MRLSELKIIIATFSEDEAPRGKRYMAQSNDYPVINGSGNSVDDAVEDLFFHILMHLHNLRVGR